MSERAPTPEQAAAIGVSGRDVLLEAGAGTGKTGVMVERYCRLVCDEELSPDTVLAFTFTDRAAAELRQRIRAELQRRAAAGGDRARRLLPKIGGAWVTTIHGFCNRLLSAHPVAAGIDPHFRVLDEAEAERAAREAFDEALEELLAAGAGSPEDTLAAFGVEGLRRIVIDAHAELRSRGEAKPALPEPPRPDVEGAIGRAAEVAAATLDALKPGDRNRELVERAAGVLREGTPPGLDELVALRTESGARALAAYRKAIDAAVARVAEAGEGGDAYRDIAALLGLFSARYRAAKAARAGVDFEDLQLLAASLLERAEIGEAYRARFRHLMVDEFQDTNRLQLRLLEALRGPQSELVVVGDELQSIYGFRHADLDAFRDQRQRIEERENGVAMELSGNFRSRPEVVAAVNALGGALLGDSYRPLRVGALPSSDPCGGRPLVELLLTGRDGWDGARIDLDPAVDSRMPLNCLAESRFLAARLRKLAESGVPRSDMVVLLRAFTHLDAYEDSLERAGLRPYVVGGRGYWSQQQVADVCALLGTIANPLDDQALFGALASPACAAAPDTLWLLRAAAGRGRHVWPALERAVAGGNAELADPERLEQIPGPERELLRRFATAVEELRRRGPRLALAELIDAAIGETGYDLAVLMRPAGEARFANVRKLMRLATEFEANEGRDLRGLLDFLASRAESEGEAQAATAAEGHDGVRIMTVHNAKGLEFAVVAVPDLSRSLLAGARPPLLSLGRGPAPSVGLQLRRLGAPSVNLYSHTELCEAAKGRDAEEGLRLFHVAATRARERLILSGVVKPEPSRETRPATPVIERIVDGLGIERDADSALAVPPPQPRAGLEARFDPAQIEVRVNLPSPERAAELARRVPASAGRRLLGEGPAPLVEGRAAAAPKRPLSYSAIAAFEECPYRFHLERALDLGPHVRRSSHEPRRAAVITNGGKGGREERATVGVIVHELLRWSQANGWKEPPPDLVRRQATAAGLDGAAVGPDSLLQPVRAWLGSSLLAQVRASPDARVRAETPLLLRVADTVLRGSIDLLVESDGAPPLVVDYKTDRLDRAAPAARATHYELQRDIYALAVAESRNASQVEVAYVFLERPQEPVLKTLDRSGIDTARMRLTAAIERMERGDLGPAPQAARDWRLCEGCPALRRTCAGPTT